MPDRAIALEYHDVISEGGAPDDSGFPGTAPASYKVERSLFAEHLSAMAAGKAAGAIARVDDMPATGTPVFLTFDDGGRSAYTDVAGMLEEHGWPGHFMVTTDHIGTPTFLNADEIVELDRRGHVICAHSASHPLRMGALARETIEDEWVRSVGVLGEILGRPCDSASVPGGLYVPKVAHAAAAAGIRFLFTSEATTRVQRVGSCLVLGRYSIRSWTKAGTAAGIAEGRIRPRLRQWWAGKSRKAIRTAGGPVYLKLRNFYWERIAGGE